MRSFFPGYPGGRSGVGLLALRAGLGLAFIGQGAYCLFESGPVPGAWLGFTALVAGILLTVGFLTPLAAPLVALSAAGYVHLLQRACTASLFDGKLSVALAGVILLAVLLLGPGAFSIDARAFGRREIIIPPTSSSRR